MKAIKSISKIADYERSMRNEMITKKAKKISEISFLLSIIITFILIFIPIEIYEPVIYNIYTSFDKENKEIAAQAKEAASDSGTEVIISGILYDIDYEYYKLMIVEFFFIIVFISYAVVRIVYDFSR
jgi:hypothetical protein